MKKSPLSIALILLFHFGLCAQNSFVPNQLIVQINTPLSEWNFAEAPLSSGNEAFDGLNRNHGVESVRLTGKRSDKNTFVLTFKAEKDILELVGEYKRTSIFNYVEPNFIGQGAGVKGECALGPDDTHFNLQYGLLNTGSFPLFPGAIPDADTDMDLAWDVTTGSNEIILAILDTGMKMDHPEFAGRIWTNPGEIGNFSDTDMNGYIDDINGYDFAYNEANASDDYGHGTNVAGIAAATGNNGIGYAGVDWNCRIMN